MPSDSPSRGARWALVIGIGALAVAACAGVAVVGAAAAMVALRDSPAPVPVGGPVAIVRTIASPVKTPSATRVEGLFVYVDAPRVAAAAPARFSAPVPANLDDFFAFTDGDGRFPTYGHVREKVCAGDPVVGAQIVVGWRGAMRAGATEREFVASYGRLFDDCGIGSDPCPLLRSAVVGNESDAVKAPFWTALAGCADVETAALFERSDVPDRAWIARMSVQPPQRWSKRLEETAARQIVNGEPWEAQTAALVLGATDDPRVAKALLAIHAAETDAVKRAGVAVAMYRQSDPAAKALFEKTCAEMSERNTICSRPRGENAALPDRVTALATKRIDDLLNDYGIDAGDIVEANEKARRAELIAALEQCAESYSEWRGRQCLSALSALDWKRASAIAVKMSRPEDPGAGELRHALRLFDDRPSYLARLRSDGVLRTGDPIDPRAGDARTLLRTAGRAHDTDAETGVYPNEHDALLYRLARLARPDLDGILFLETAPSLDEESGETDGSPYVVDAWLGGEKWTVELEDLEDWYDIERCVGLLNTILRDRGSDTRLVSLATGDQTAVLVAGSEDGLARLARDRLLATTDPGRLEDAGKAFERQALDAVRRSQGAER